MFSAVNGSYCTVKNARRYLLILILVAAGFSLYRCGGPHPRPVYVRDGRQYGVVRGAFRSRWWNYYERGLSFADGEFYQEAVSDFRQAIHQREKDQRMARTYGMHFIDYFPHRELGIAFYQMGDLKAAKRELELSLSQFPSAKARFYLDRVRRALIEKGGKEASLPGVSLDFKTAEVWTREDPVIISGVAEDENYVSAISIRGVPLFLEGSQKSISFKQSLNLPQGKHAIEVAAKNLAGKVTKRTVVIHVDREGPIITVGELRIDRRTREIAISGSIYDESGVSELTIDGQSITIEPGTDIPFARKFATDKKSLNLVARDRLGNRTSAQISLPQNLNESATSIEEWRGNTAPWKSQIANRKSQIPPPLIASLDSDVNPYLLAGLFSPRDTRPPTIRLKGFTNKQTVFLPKIYIEGQVTDESKIVGLSINDVPVLHRKGLSIFFSHLSELREGENSITVEAVDENGNRATKTISVTRAVPKALQLDKRLSMTVLPFEQTGAVSQVGLSFQDNLIDSLVDQDRFWVIERAKLDLILQEQKLSRSRLIDRRTALRLGRLVAAQAVVTGSIIETRTGIEIVGRMIDTETSEILATEDVYGEVKDLPALRSLAEGMAIKFHRDFPLVDGVVIQRKGSEILTDLGKDKVKLHRRLLVYREHPVRHPLTGKVLGADNEIIGRARVIQVMPEMSKAELLDASTGVIKSLDKVITE
ncbi:MAG: hypothetical protein JRI41_04650 [Deltaproteobacteria bacterium]|nr:hypothetical protein [Deltaproteobacteria bacterium]